MRKPFVATEELKKMNCDLCFQNFEAGQVVERKFNSYELRSKYRHKKCPIPNALIQEENLAQNIGNQERVGLSESMYEEYDND